MSGLNTSNRWLTHLEGKNDEKSFSVRVIRLDWGRESSSRNNHGTTVGVIFRFGLNWVVAEVGGDDEVLFNLKEIDCWASASSPQSYFAADVNFSAQVFHDGNN